MNRMLLLFLLFFVFVSGARETQSLYKDSPDLNAFPKELKYTAVFSTKTKIPNKKKHKVKVSYFNKKTPTVLYVETFKRKAISANKLSLTLGSGKQKNKWFHKKNRYSSLQHLLANNQNLEMLIELDGKAYYPKIGLLPEGHSQKTAALLSHVDDEDDKNKKHWKGYTRKASFTAFQAVELTAEDYNIYHQENIKTNPYTIKMKGPILSVPLSSLSLARTKALNQSEVNIPRHEDLFDQQGVRFGTGTRKADDPLARLSQAGGSFPNIQTPVASGFQGMPNISGFLPPDTEGAVGPNHYVQQVNSTTQVFNKNGSTAAGPYNTNTLWTGFGGRCESDNSGDAVALYDEQADRWILTQFAVAAAPEQICFAVSQTNDPTGSYYLYSFVSQRFPDYYKLGVWPATNNNAYFIGTNSGLQGQYDIYAVDRENMLLGNVARTAQFFQSFPNLMMPADNDGVLPPSANTPGYFYTIRDGGESYFGSPPSDSIDIYEYDVDWVTPANSTIVLTQSFTSATGLQDFNWTVCGFFVSNCIPQLGSGTLIDSNSWWPQQRFQYRNYGIYGSLVGTWGVNAVASPGKHTAPRWFELRRYTTEPSWTIRQQGTWAPDSNHRFSPSIAMDESQNIGLGYSETSSTMFPGISYTVHDNDIDDLGIMEPEATMFNGLSAQTHSSGRWGDYASMEVDPSDNCTFWFSTEYIEANNWKTYIGQFKVPGCKEHNILLYNDYTTEHSINVCKTSGLVDTPMAISYDFNTATTFSVTSACPAGAVCSFLSNPVTFPNDTTLRISNLAAVAGGAYSLEVTATDGGSKTDTENFTLNVFEPITTSPLLSSPSDGAIDELLTPTLTWNVVGDALSYDVEIATDPGFLNIVETANLTGTNYTPVVLNSDSFYYWRVRGNNSCGNGPFIVAAFATLASGGASSNTTCSNPGVAIPDGNASGVNDSLIIATGGSITDIDITIDASHSWVGDLIFTVTNMSSGTSVTVIDQPGVPGSTFGCSRNNINTTLDDASGTAVENQCTNPTAIGTGPFSPNNPLSAFNGEISIATWQINASDRVGSFTGTLNQWCVVAGYTTSSPAIPADYSDLSSSYGVAKHEGGGAFKLGTNWTADADFSLDSDIADDDGIVASGNWEVGSNSAVLTISPNLAGFVSCWFDWNNDGSFASGEKTINQSVSSGANILSIPIPAGSTFGNVGDDFLETRCRFYNGIQAKAPSSPTGPSGSGEVEDYRLPAASLTPVTLAYSKASQIKSDFKLEWSTTTEAGTISFDVYGLENNVWTLLNAKPIAAKGINSIVPHDYDLIVGNSLITAYKINELTAKGTTITYGPYTTNTTFGKYPDVNPIDWSNIAQESRDKSVNRSFNRAVIDYVKVAVKQTGIQRVTYEQLLALGVDWQGVGASELSLSFESQAFPRYVSDAVFGPGSYIEFVGESTKTLYTDTNIYLLKRDANLVKQVLSDNSSDYLIDPDAYFMAEVIEQRDLAYSFASPADSPWFFASMLAQTTERSWDYSLSAPHLIDNGISSSFEFKAWGATDFPEDNDHHLQVFIAAQQISDLVFDGLVLASDTVALDYAVVSGLSSVTFKLPADTASAADLIQLDSYKLKYPSELTADNDQIQFTPIINQAYTDTMFFDSFESTTVKTQPSLTNASHGFIANGFSSQDIVAYAFDGSNLINFPMANIAANGSGFEVSLPNVGLVDIKYYVVTGSNVVVPEISVGNDTNIDLSQNYDYLMISHPDFIDALLPLVNYHQSNGLRVLVVDVVDVYAQYSHHRTDAYAIKSFISDAAIQSGINSVLLVGGDSYDYLDNLGIGSISFIPTLYYPTDDIVKFTPTDALLVDTDDNLVPDLAIGRLPVRTSTEIQTMIDKTLLFNNRTYINSAVFASDRNVLFDNLSDQMLNKLPLNWQIDTAYINNLELLGAKNALINSIETGVSLTSFFGHSGPYTWSFEHLFDSDDILLLNNTNKPTLVAQYGCWNAYFVMPNNSTMSQLFLNLDNKGAVAILGASTLTDSSHEASLGNLLMPIISSANVTTGEAVLQAKSELAKTNPGYLDVILGWTLLGDPMIVLDQQ